MLIVASEDQFGLTDGTDADYLAAKEKCGFRFDLITGMLLGVAANVHYINENRSFFVDPLRITKDAAAMYAQQIAEEKPAASTLCLAYNIVKKRFEVTFGAGPSWKTDYLLVKENGFKFDKENKCWYTKKKNVAATLQQYAQPDAIEKIGKTILDKAPKPVEWDESEHRAALKKQLTPEQCIDYIESRGWKRNSDSMWIHINELEPYDTIRAIWRQRDRERERERAIKSGENSLDIVS
jgi:hypothetical protein